MNPLQSSIPPDLPYPPLSSSPLNRAANRFPTPLGRRISVDTGLITRKHPALNTPLRALPRSPLSFVTPSPASTTSNHSQISSSPSWNIRTPLSSATSGIDLAPSSLTDSPPATIVYLNKLKSGIPISSLRINTPAMDSSSPTGSSPLSSVHPAEPHIPSPLDKLDHLMPIPASPTVVDPVYLLGLPPNDLDESMHTAALPLHSTATSVAEPMMPRSHRLDAVGRRGSTLVPRPDRFDIHPDQSTGGPVDNRPNDPPSHIPSRMPPRRV